MGVRFTQARFAITQRLDLGAAEDETRLPRLEEVVIVTGARVPRDRNFFHDDIGKIRIDLGLYNNLDCRSSKVLAEVVELVDALASGASGRKPVGVRVPPSACGKRRRGAACCAPTVFQTRVQFDQYRGNAGSTFTAHASIPPRRLRTFEKPAALRISSALSERAPWWQCVTISW